ncbi:MAG: hypothetical protein Q9226_001310 [Calogaya cf. arnoldii]
MIQFFHVFHGQVVRRNPYRPDTQWIIENNNLRPDIDPDPEFQNDFIAVPAPNQRTQVLDCGRVNGQPRIWYPGYTQDVPPAAIPLQRFGQFMRQAGILTGDNYQRYDPNRGQRGGWIWPTTGNEQRNSNQFGPIEGAVRQQPTDMNPNRGWPTLFNDADSFLGKSLLEIA